VNLDYTVNRKEEPLPNFDDLWNSAPPIVLAGATASGKTACAIELAEHIGAEIVNADSQQVYRGMDIGTAKPTQEEQARIPFHLLDIVEPDASFSVAEWKSLAERVIHAIISKGKRVIICGGTGMYIRALLENWTLAETPQNPEIREELRAKLQQSGAPSLHERLKQVDPATAKRLHPNDGVRIVRALEVFEITQKPISLWQEQDQSSRRVRPSHFLGLALPRPELYERIDQRVDTMLEQGLLEEVRTLISQGYAPNHSSLNSLGYKEMCAYVQGELDLQTATEAIKQNTRRYAKRQLTWFRAERKIVWVEVSGLETGAVVDKLLTHLLGKPTGEEPHASPL
jgi:tRNA dimethylallyltransferase